MTCSNLQQSARLSANRIGEENFAVLRLHHPLLAARLETFPGKDRVRIGPSRDGSVFYGYQERDRVIPVTDPVAPIRRLQAQLDQYSAQLADTTRPVLIVGLYPGTEVLSIFDQCERIPTPHCPQPILLCIDSLIALHGFLQTWDARRILESPRVRLVWHGDLAQEVERLRQHPEIPHVFTLITGAADATLNTVLPPLATLIREREDETARLCVENREYYNRLDDRQLADALAGKAGRKPRLLMPTCVWSTFIQHSTRDTCAAFEKLGWETRILPMDAMLTPYHLVRQIHAFKPDVFLFIDHLRHEAEEIYPRGLMFVTWVQDEMGHIHCAAAGRKLTEYAAAGRRDFVIGHVDRLEKQFGYPADRLVQLPIPADPRVFHPIVPTADERRLYGCELAFMSNVSAPSERVVDTRIIPQVEPLGVSATTVRAIHDHLRAAYREGRVFCDRDAFLGALQPFPEFAEAYARPSRDGENRQETLLRLFLWGLNDTMYRHTVLEWIDELGLALHLYGCGWEQHPRFAKYARGALQHGAELSAAYQAARLNLHLNIAYGMHQRLWEILAAGARPFLRAPSPDPLAPPATVAHEVARFLMNDPDVPALSDNAQAVFCEMALNEALTAAREERDAPDPAPAAFEDRVIARVEQRALSRPDWVIDRFEQHSFHDRRSFEERVTAALRESDPAGSARASVHRYGNYVTAAETVIAALLARLGDPAEAAGRRAYRLPAYDRARAAIRLARILAAPGDAGTAVEWKHATYVADSPDAHVQFALKLYRNGQRDAALFILEHERPSDLRNAGAYVCAAIDLPDPAQRRRLLRRVTPNCVLPDAATATCLAQILCTLGLFDQALGWIARLEQDGGAREDLLKHKVFALLGSWRHEHALREIRDATGAGGRQPLHRILDAVVLSRMGRADDAMESIRPILDNARYGRAAQLHRALLLRSGGDLDAAATVLASLAPSAADWRIHFELSVCQIAQGRTDVALESARQGATRFADAADNLCAGLCDVLSSASFPASPQFAERCLDAISRSTMPFYHEYAAIPALWATRNELLRNGTRRALADLLEQPFSVCAEALDALRALLAVQPAPDIDTLAALLSFGLFPWHGENTFECTLLKRIASRP